MCACVYNCTHMCTYLCVCVCVYYLCVCMSVCMYLYLCMHVCTHLYVCICVCMCACYVCLCVLSVCVCLCVHVCICVCMCVAHHSLWAACSPGTPHCLLAADGEVTGAIGARLGRTVLTWFQNLRNNLKSRKFHTARKKLEILQERAFQDFWSRGN